MRHFRAKSQHLDTLPTKKDQPRRGRRGLGSTPKNAGWAEPSPTLTRPEQEKKLTRNLDPRAKNVRDVNELGPSPQARRDFSQPARPAAIGGREGGDSHRLTPQNTVSLPKAIFDPPNRAKRKFFRATPSLRLKKSRKF